MVTTVVVKKSDYSITSKYYGTPIQSDYGGVWSKSSKFTHIQVPGGMDKDVVIAQDDGGGGIELVEDSTKVATRKTNKWDKERSDRNTRLDSTDKTMISDTPGGWDDWTTYRQSLRDHMQDLATKDVALDSSVGQDDMTVKGEGGCSCDITTEVNDPGSASQSLTVTVTGKDIKVDLATDSGSAITSTVQDVIDAINNDGDSNVLVTASLKAGATGANIVDTEVTKTSLVTEAEIDAASWPTAPTNPVIDGLS